MSDGTYMRSKGMYDMYQGVFYAQVVLQQPQVCRCIKNIINICLEFTY